MGVSIIFTHSHFGIPLFWKHPYILHINSQGGLLSAFPSGIGELLEHSSMETVELPPMTDLAQFHCLRLMGCKRHGNV